MNRNPSDAPWFKSSHSNADQDCVEVAFLGDMVRDSKNPNGSALVFSSSAWGAFTAGIAGVVFDLR
ncbi:DUF397 domain-containing protein [Nocardia sp. CS682]|uniref:DUF397 domain-containing protein n=1 Tax=Nocardia sp. CS682 TaxID=1047172 RepID=UPI0010757F47|nr:DUF397 domain-containing protein [Nocardia sp. CS682]QBS43761.1 DUF397 domain-containing protein [Nocardia sp. CS682]